MGSNAGSQRSLSHTFLYSQVYQNPERKKVAVAKYARGYQSIVPVGAITRIQYFPPKGQQNRQEGKKEQSFQMMFQMKLNEIPMDENQSFQAYC